MSDESQASKSHLYILGLHSLSSSIAGTGRPVLIVCLWTSPEAIFEIERLPPKASGCLLPAAAAGL